MFIFLSFIRIKQEINQNGIYLFHKMLNITAIRTKNTTQTTSTALFSHLLLDELVLTIFL